MSTRSIIVLLLLVQKGLTERNVALKKKATYCEMNMQLSKELLDGNRNISYVIDTLCIHYSYIEVNLGKEYLVHYAVLYEGYSHLENSHLTWRSLLVEFIEIGNTVLCGKNLVYHPRNFKRTTNCFKSETPHSTVRFSSNKNEGFVIAEIEVYSLGSDKHGNVTVIHRGCFENFLSLESPDELNDMSKCFGRCSASGFAVAALSMNASGMPECHCSMDYMAETEVPTKECDKFCGRKHEMCGGLGKYSVYYVKVQMPYFIGCRTMSDEDFDFEDDMSVSKCLKLCQKSTRVLLVGGNLCKCGNGSEKATDDCQCFDQCTGNPLQKCGSKNCAIIYGTCLIGDSYTLKCSNLFNCLGDDEDEHGICKRGCRPGFLGGHCLERVMNADECMIENPCQNISNSRCLLNRNKTECECIDGYHWSASGDFCLASKEKRIDFEALFLGIFLAMILLVLGLNYWYFATNPKTSLMTSTTASSQSRKSSSHQNPLGI